MTTNNNTPEHGTPHRTAPPVATLPSNGTRDVRRSDKPPLPGGPQSSAETGASSAAAEPRSIRVLLLEADRRRSDALKARLAGSNLQADVVRADSQEEFFTLLGQFQFDCLLIGRLETELPPFLEKVRSQSKAAAPVFLSDAADRDALADAAQRGLCGLADGQDAGELAAELMRARSRHVRTGVVGAELEGLSETEDRFRQIAESLHQAFWISRASDGHLISVNQHFAELCGCTGATCAQRFIDIVHPEDQERVAGVLDLDGSRREFEFECRTRLHDGSVRWTTTHGFPIRDEKGECVRIVGITDDTTEHRRLQRESQKLNKMLGAFPDTCLLVNADGSVGDIQLKDDSGLFTTPAAEGDASLRSLLPAGPATLVERTVSECALDQRPRSVEFHHTARGARRLYEARVCPVGEGPCLVFIREMPAARAGENPAGDAGGQWAALVDTLPVILFIQHRVGEWGSCLFSDGCDRLTGFAPGQIDGGDLPVLASLMHWEDIESALAEVELADWEKRPYEIEYRVRTAAGKERWFREHGHALRDDHGEVVGHEGFILDITAEQRLEAELSEMVARIGTPAASLVNGLRTPESDERLHTIEAVFRGLMHHFSSALMRIRGSCDTLTTQLHRAGPSASASAVETLSVLRGASAETTRMLRQLCEVILAEKPSLRAQPMDLNWVAQEAVEQAVVRQGATHPGALNIHSQLCPLPPLQGNAASFLNSLSSLLCALAAGNTGNSRILLRTSNDAEGALLEIGLDADASLTGPHRSGLDGAFQEFRGIMELQGASVEESPDTLSLRVRVPSDIQLETAHPPFQPVSGPRRRILVVDDEPLILDILREYLAEDGHEVVTATTGDEALASLAVGRFDLVLTDRSMPGISGDKLAETIHHQDPRLPVVMVTGMSDVMRASGERPEHCNLILGKPVSQDSLRAALLQAVAN